MPDRMTFHSSGQGLREKQIFLSKDFLSAAPLRALQPQASSSATPARQISYPLKPDESMKKIIESAVSKLDLYSMQTKWSSIRRRITKATGTDNYMNFNDKDIVWRNFDRNRDIVDDVLFVSMKFGWNPEEVLALWQIEGLPTWLNVRGNPIDIPRYYQAPRNRAEARAFARSIVLFEWWGLDVLAPVQEILHQDNVLDPDSASIDAHDRAFEDGFAKEIDGTYLPISPRESLEQWRVSEGEQAFNFFPSGQFTSCKFNLRYQATLLALQFAHYKRREREISGFVENDSGQTASLTPPFPALVYLKVNTKYFDASAKKMMRGLKGKQHYSSQELCRAFLTTRLPVEVSNWINTHCANGRNQNICHGYMNALRFEYLRQVYEIYFRPINIASPRGC